jgi:hypothetical protein
VAAARTRGGLAPCFSTCVPQCSEFKKMHVHAFNSGSQSEVLVRPVLSSYQPVTVSIKL